MGNVDEKEIVVIDWDSVDWELLRHNLEAIRQSAAILETSLMGFLNALANEIGVLCEAFDELNRSPFEEQNKR